MKKNNSFIKELDTIGYQELKDSIGTITSISPFATHISLELAISSSKKITTDQRIELMSLLFMVSLRKGTYQDKSLIKRIDSLAVSVSDKEKVRNAISPLLDNPLAIVKQVRAMVNNLFAAPSTCADDLINLAEWIRTYPALLNDEQELLSTMARQRAIMLDMALEGDDSTTKELIELRNHWYLENIANADTVEELNQLQKVILNDNLTSISQSRLNSLIEHAEASIEANGLVDLEECITHMIHTAILACRANACVEASPDYADGVNQITRWFSDFLKSPLMNSLVSLAKQKAAQDIKTLQLPAFKTRSLMVYSH